MGSGDAVAAILAALERAGARPRPRGELWQFFCPIHEDGANPAGELSQGEKGALIVCHAGCDKARLLEQIGLTMGDLFDDKGSGRRDWNNPDVRYPYRDKTGHVLYEVRRIGFGHGKSILPFLPSGKSGLPPQGERVLYRLPELLKAVAENWTVFLCEGERDADAAAAKGMAATTAAGGASGWKPHYSLQLEGVDDVVVVAHKDEAGYNYARRLVKELDRPGRQLRVVEALVGNDLVDHLAAGHDIGDLRVLSPEELAVAGIETVAAPPTSTNGHVPAPATSAAYAWPTLDAGALYGIVGEAVRAVAPYTEADPAAILLTLLCLSGISIGPGPRIHAGLEPQPGRLQVWVVGESAVGRKGSSWGAARSIMTIADDGLMANRVLSGFGSGEALVDAAADPEARDCRLVVLAREGGQLLSIISRRGDTTSTVLRETYDTDNLAVRSRNKTSVTALAHIGLVAHITPADLVGMLTETQIRNGFANRGLFVASRRPHLIPRGRPAPAEVDVIAGRLGDAIRRGRSLGAVSFETAAGDAWDAAYARFGSDAPSPLLADLEARGDMHTLRLAMIFALLDGSALIEVCHLEAALAVWRYCRDSARYVFGVDGAMDEARELSEVGRERKRFEDDLARLEEALRSSGSLTGTEQRALFSNRAGGKSSYLGKLRKELISRGLAVERPQNSGGRPRQVLVVVER